MKRFLPVIAALFLALLFAPAGFAHETKTATPEPSPGGVEAVAKGGFEGRVVVEGSILPGARVYAYKSFADFIDSKPFAASGVIGDDGKYTLDLPRGSYYLVAKKRKDMTVDGPVLPGELFSFQGSNPVTVIPDKYVHVGFSLLPFEKESTYEPYDDAGAGGLAGKVTYEGQPLDGVFVTLYMDTAEDLRGATYASSPPTGKSGVFRFDGLPEVDYFVVARKRASGKGAGPLTDGDYFGFYPGNPILVKAGKLATIEIPLITKAGEIGRDDSLFRDTGTNVQGKILDKNGNPVPGVYVFAYLEKVMAHKRPEFISRAAGPDGKFVLNLPSGGTYYIGARSNYGDTPALGEWYGRWEGTGDHSIVLKTSESLTGVDITVEKILP